MYDLFLKNISVLIIYGFRYKLPYIYYARYRYNAISYDENSTSIVNHLLSVSCPCFCCEKGKYLLKGTRSCYLCELLYINKNKTVVLI